jgi:predicted Ser/Thr protein kinase
VTETKNICPGCQKPVPQGTPLGLCPECLIKSGFNTSTEPDDDAPQPPFVPPTVEQIAGLFPQFEMIGLIGKGGMGAVYQARQPALDRFVALKILRPNLAGDPGFEERFTREARALARLNHPNIVAVYDFGKAGELHYLVMEFVEGANLRAVQRAGRIAPGQALQIVPQICDALQFAHGEGIVHRDIKPENILFDKKGRVKITDFGIAKMGGDVREKLGLTGAKDVVGTPHYMAPEQVERPQSVDHRADIYSLGVVFYELLTGELPLGKFSVPSDKAAVDERLDDVVLRALEKEPARRYQQAREIKTDVQTIASTPAASLKSQGVVGAAPLNAGSADRPTQGKMPRWIFATIPAALLLILIPVALVVFGVFYFLPGDRMVRVAPAATNAPGPPLSYQGRKTGEEPVVIAVTNVSTPKLTYQWMAGEKTVQSVVSNVAFVTAVQPAPVLRYQWKTGETFVYSVNLEAEHEDSTELVTGNIIYQVKEVRGDIATLSFRSRFSPSFPRPKPGRMVRIQRGGTGQFWTGWAFPSYPFRELNVDPAGRIVGETGRSSSSEAMGDADRLVLEIWRDGSSWETQNACTIVQSENGMPRMPVPSSSQTTLQADEKAAYTIGSPTGDIVPITKKYEMKSRENIGNAPRVQITGEETIQFDSKAGVLRSVGFTGVVTHVTANSSTRTPFTLTCTLLSGEAREKILNPPPPAKVEPKELSAADLKDTLNDLQSSESYRRGRAADRLAAAKPTDPREPVVQELIAALDDPSYSLRSSVVKAMGVWRTDSVLPPLLKALEDPESSVRGAAIEALTPVNDPQVAQALAKHLARGSDSWQTATALKAMGPAAEKPVADLLQNRSADTRREACRILKDIGTTNSTAALTTASTDSDGVVALMAKEALKAVESRSVKNIVSPQNLLKDR